MRELLAFRLPCPSQAAAACAPLCLPACRPRPSAVAQVPCPRLTRLTPPCPRPPAHPQSALGPELLVALEARGTVFLPPSATAVEDYARKTIAAEQTEDNFFV